MEYGLSVFQGRVFCGNSSLELRYEDFCLFEVCEHIIESILVYFYWMSMLKRLNKEVGKIGEQIAENFLVKKGYELVLRNFGTKFGEIDLIMKQNDILVFIEVKTKKGLRFGTPEEMFSRGKYERVKRMATVYLKGEEVPCRIDMVAVELDDNNLPVDVRHYENVTT